MKRLGFIFTALLLSLAGCKELQEPDTPKEPDMTLSIGNISCDTGSITFTISATGKDVHLFNRWGVTYGES